LDYPKDKSAAVTLKAQDDSSFTDFRVAAAKALNVTEKQLSHYSFVAAAYQTLPTSITSSDESKTLKQLGLKDGSSVFGLAPASAKPQRRSKEKAEEKKDDKKKKKPNQRSAEDYKAFTPSNVLKKWLSSDGKKKVLAFEYIEMKAKDVLATDAFNALSKENVILIIKSDQLNAKEVEIFTALLAWGKEEAKRQKKDPKKASELKEALGETFELIRFPLMEIQNIATTVAGSELLSQEQMLALFTYMGSKDKKSTKLDSSLKMFSTKPRKARLMWADFTFDGARKGAAMVLSNDDRTVKQTYGTSQWNSIACKEWVSEGVHKVYFKIDASTASHWLFLGVVGRGYGGFTDTSSGYIGSNSSTSWGWSDGGGSSALYPNTRGGSYGTRPYRTGDIVEMTIDMDNKTVSFKINDEPSLGVAFTGINSEVTVAVTTYDSNDQVSLVGGPDG